MLRIYLTYLEINDDNNNNNKSIIIQITHVNPNTDKLSGEIR